MSALFAEKVEALKRLLKVSFAWIRMLGEYSSISFRAHCSLASRSFCGPCIERIDGNNWF